MTDLAPETVLRRRPDVLTTDVPDGYLVLDMTTFNCLSFVGSASRIWELLSEPMSVAALCARLRLEFRVDEATCLRETLAHLGRLSDRGLVQVCDGAT